MLNHQPHELAAVAIENTERSPVILIVDDDPATRLLLRQALERSDYQFIDAINGQEAVALSQKYAPDLILMDAVMPVMDGFTACKRLRDLGINTPILIITGLDDDESVERAFQYGAEDFVPKPIHWAVLRQRVARILHARRSEKYIAHLAYHDPLTGLSNRQLFMDRFGAALSRARRSGEHVALLFVDLDRFKQINDTLGHNAGDAVLRHIAERLVSCVREGDTVARLGGDEFAIVLEGIQRSKDVAIVAEKALTALNTPIKVEERNLHVTASVGIAVYPEDGDNISVLMQNADGAMYRVKQQGRKGYQFHTKEMTEAALRRLLLTKSLHNALREDELALFYQPRYRLHEHGTKLIAMEALVRWQHPELGLIYPNEFIPLAEEMGLIVAFGEWVLRRACEQGEIWRTQGFPHLQMAVNLSALQLQQRDLLAMVTSVLQETGWSAEQLELEISESSFPTDSHEITEVLQSLNQMGVKLLFDDFGTGYSSLTQLRQLPIEAIKIDYTLVKNLPHDDGAVAIVKAIIAIAHSLSLDVVAEGVEHDEQLEFLRQLGCQDVQGFLFSEPRLPEQLALSPELSVAV